MRKEIGVDADAPFWRVLDLETGELIDRCFFADDKTGEYGVYKTDSSGKLIVENGNVVRQFKKGRIKLIPKGSGGKNDL